MKKHFRYSIFALVALFMLSVLVYSCQKEAPAPTPAPLPAPTSFGAIYHVGINVATELDTISTSSSLDTIDYTVGEFSKPMNVEVQLQADSISGSTGAVCTMQNSFHATGSSYNNWVDISGATATINGVQTRARIVTAVLKGRVRCRCIAPSSTQNTRVRWIGYATEDNP